jgi:hypothetical protein
MTEQLRDREGNSRSNGRDTGLEDGTRPWQLYVLAMAGAIVTAFIDFSQNLESSAITKVTWGLARLLDAPPSSRVQVSVLLFFCVVSCIFVFAHRPKGRSHALAIGAGVLTALNLGVSTRHTMAVPKAAAMPPHASVADRAIGLLLAPAHAQGPAITATLPAAKTTRNYVFVEGLMTLGDRGEVTIFDSRGEILDRRRAGPAFQFDAAPGSYTLLFAQDGHRQVKLDVQVTDAPTAFRMRTRPVYDIQNFLGARELPRNQDGNLGRLLRSISNDCSKSDLEGVRMKLQQLPKNDLARIQRSSANGLQQSLCSSQVGETARNVN